MSIQGIIRKLIDVENRSSWWDRYSQFLKSPAWEAQRRRVLERDKWTCRGCGSAGGKLHVHHMSYRMYNKIGRSMDYELITLCECCHRLHHDHMNH